MRTEDDWLTCTAPAKMMRYLRPDAGLYLPSWFGDPSRGILEKRWRRFLGAYCRHVAPLIGETNRKSQRLIDFAEQFIDCEPTLEASETVEKWYGYARLSTKSLRLLRGMRWPLSDAAGQLRELVGRHARSLTVAKNQMDAAERSALDFEAVVQCNFIRDLFGNPFRPVIFSPAFCTEGVRKLAREICETADFSRMTNLSELLCEAGCSDVNVISHCRDVKIHIQGCWVIEMLLNWPPAWPGFHC